MWQLKPSDLKKFQYINKEVCKTSTAIATVALHEHILLIEGILISGQISKSIGDVSGKTDLAKLENHRITESQNSRGWKGPLWVI